MRTFAYTELTVDDTDARIEKISKLLDLLESHIVRYETSWIDFRSLSPDTLQGVAAAWELHNQYCDELNDLRQRYMSQWYRADKLKIAQDTAHAQEMDVREQEIDTYAEEMGQES